MRVVAQLVLAASWLGLGVLVVAGNVAEQRARRRTPRSRFEQAQWSRCEEAVGTTGRRLPRSGTTRPPG
jgi:hypothetical protein